MEEGYASPERVERFKRESFLRSRFTKPTAAVDILLSARHRNLERAAQAAAEPETPDDFLE